MPSAPSAWASSRARACASGPSCSIWRSSSMNDCWVEEASAGAAASRERAVAASSAARGLREVIESFERRARAQVAARARRSPRLRSARYRLMALGDLAPAHRVPPRVDVVGTPVLILQVVGVLPDVDAQERRLALGDRVVLVGGADARQPGAVVHEPRPAGAELVDAGLLELGLEVPEGAECRGDRVRQRAVGLAAAVRAHA